MFLLPNTARGKKDKLVYEAETNSAQLLVNNSDNSEEDDEFAVSERKRMRWNEDTSKRDRGSNISLFQVFYRSMLEEHVNACVKDPCRTCSINPADSFSWDEKFRYGVLEKKFENKNLAEILRGKGWRSNCLNDVSKTPSITPSLSKLRRRIELDNEQQPRNLDLSTSIINLD